MGLLWMERREAGWEWTGNARVGGECSDPAGNPGDGGRTSSHSIIPVLWQTFFLRERSLKKSVGFAAWGARAVPALAFWLADVDRVELEPASNRKRFTADDGHVVEAIDAIEPAAGVQHRRLPGSDTTLGAP